MKRPSHVIIFCCVRSMFSFRRNAWAPLTARQSLSPGGGRQAGLSDVSSRPISALHSDPRSNADGLGCPGSLTVRVVAEEAGHSWKCLNYLERTTCEWKNLTAGEWNSVTTVRLKSFWIWLSYYVLFCYLVVLPFLKNEHSLTTFTKLLRMCIFNENKQAS